MVTMTGVYVLVISTFVGGMVLAMSLLVGGMAALIIGFSMGKLSVRLPQRPVQFLAVVTWTLILVGVYAALGISPITLLYPTIFPFVLVTAYLSARWGYRLSRSHAGERPVAAEE